jgi:aconitate hydratase
LHWEQDSTYMRRPPFLEGLSLTPDALTDIHEARALAVLGDSITTDHISPAGAIKADSPAGRYLVGNDIPPRDFNSYGARARQSRSDDAGHLRQHPHQEPDGSRSRRRRDGASAGR